MTAQGASQGVIDVDVDLVRVLLREQHPDLAEHRLELRAFGWVNAMFRLGPDLAVRMPRRALGATLIEKEQRWLPVVAPGLPLPAPSPVRLGAPSPDYPWRWSVVPWIKGKPADLDEPDTTQGAVLGDFLRALHLPPPADAPRSSHRGVPLTDLVGTMAERLQRVEEQAPVLTPDHLALWETGLATPMDLEPTWVHGDLHARNVLTAQGKFTAVIDWGDMTAGDPATDLAAIWMLLPDRQAREAAWEAYGPISKATLARAKGWAVLFGVMLVDIGLFDAPWMGVMGHRTLERVLAGP